MTHRENLLAITEFIPSNPSLPKASQARLSGNTNNP